MRHQDLDKVLPIDKKIGKIQFDEKGAFRIINDKKIYQIEEKTQRDIDMNLIINRYRIFETQ